MSSHPPSLFSAGTHLYKYELIRQIGRGSFGEVWLVHEKALDREFALKILSPGMTVVPVLREAQIGNRLDHNNLVHVHQADVVHHNGVDFVVIAMDFHQAGSVEKCANPAGYVPLPDVLRIGRDILQGLDYLHARNFFHNDIKPGNILIGGQGQAMLSDYGITGVSNNGQPAAAPDAYLLHRAPEVRTTGNVDAVSDLFQVGMTLGRLLIGLTHLNGIWAMEGQAGYEARIDSAKLLTAGDFPSHIPPAVRRVILKSINPAPTARYASALDMRRELEKLCFPGFWTVNAAGREVGQDQTNSYAFAKVPRAAGRIDVSCTRTNLKSGNTQRVTKFCGQGLEAKAAHKMVSDFKLAVVTGK